MYALRAHDDLFRRGDPDAGQEAGREGRALALGVGADVVRRELSAVPTRKPATLPLLPEGNGLQPGIDLFDGSALADLMDSDADS